MKKLDRIDEIWNSNKKIPFMQSKEILRLGYEYGNGDCREEFLKQKQTKPVEDVNKPSKETQQSNFTKNIKNKNKIIREAKIEVLLDVIKYYGKHPNFLDMITYIEQIYKDLKNEVV